MDVDMMAPGAAVNQQQATQLDAPLANLESAIRNLRLRAQVPGGREDEEGLSESESEGEEDEGLDGTSVGANLGSPFLAAEDQGNEPDFTEDMDENGLFTYQRLTETFEKELVEACTFQS